MKIHVEDLKMNLTDPFGISRGVQTVANTVMVKIEEGLGCAAPSSFYGENTTTIKALLPLMEDVIGDDPFAVEYVDRKLNEWIKGHPAMKAAINMALYDIVGKRVGQPVWKLLGLKAEDAPYTSFTIGIDKIDVMLEKIDRAAEYPILKIKVGIPGDIEMMRRIREHTDKTLYVDANCGWTAREAIYKSDALAELGVEFIEQPMLPQDREGLRLLYKNSKLPIILDESIKTTADIPSLLGLCDGVNIKLMKCGGILEAYKIIAAARTHSLKVMCGCMVESAISISAAAQISPLLDYADLDGNLLVDDDPYEGVQVVNGKLTLSNDPGLGVKPIS